MSALEYQTKEIRMTFGFAIRAILVATNWSRPTLPRASKLAKLTSLVPDLVPRRWTHAEAKYALDHWDDLIGVAR